jgi:hypothetical protein
MSPYTSNASDSHTVLHPLCIVASRGRKIIWYLKKQKTKLILPPQCYEDHLPEKDIIEKNRGIGYLKQNFSRQKFENLLRCGLFFNNKNLKK